MFNDLKQAILAVLKDATPEFINGDLQFEGHYTGSMVIDRKLLEILQAEYNIHFVEPTDKQIDLL